MASQRNNTKHILLKAQETFINDLMLSKEDEETVVTNSQYVKNWSGFVLKLDDILYEDNIIVEENNKTYKYSKIKFLENKYFKYSLIEKYKEKLGNVFIKIIQTRNGGYIIKMYPFKTNY